MATKPTGEFTGLTIKAAELYYANELRWNLTRGSALLACTEIIDAIPDKNLGYKLFPIYMYYAIPGPEFERAMDDEIKKKEFLDNVRARSKAYMASHRLTLKPKEACADPGKAVLKYCYTTAETCARQYVLQELVCRTGTDEATGGTVSIPMSRRDANMVVWITRAGIPLFYNEKEEAKEEEIKKDKKEYEENILKRLAEFPDKPPVNTVGVLYRLRSYYAGPDFLSRYYEGREIVPVKSGRKKKPCGEETEERQDK